MAEQPEAQAEPSARRRGSFAARMSNPLPGTIEGVLAVAIILGIFVVALLVFRVPGPLVVQVQDDVGHPVMGARVKCTGPEKGRLGLFTGITDSFGEAKWPGLQKGPWQCEAIPPDLFYGETQFGATVVGSRAPAIVKLRIERSVHLQVEVLRPKSAVRSTMAVRAVCEATAGAPAVAWEARTAVLGGLAVLWIPPGRKCRTGLVHAELGARKAGLSPRVTLECDKLPCSGDLEAGVGGHAEAQLAPTEAQWLEARPAVEPDPVVP
jgi:hypothetical protein